MPRERTYSEVLNLRIDEALAGEVKRIAERRELSESEAARLLLTWGVEAHRSMEAQELLRPYDAAEPDRPGRWRGAMKWEPLDEDELPRGL